MTGKLGRLRATVLFSEQPALSLRHACIVLFQALKALILAVASSRPAGFYLSCILELGSR